MTEAARLIHNHYIVVDGDASDTDYNKRVEISKQQCLNYFVDYTSSDESNPVIALFLNLVKQDRIINVIFAMGAQDTAEILEVGRNMMESTLRAIVEKITNGIIVSSNYDKDFVNHLVIKNNIIQFPKRIRTHKKERS